MFSGFQSVLQNKICVQKCVHAVGFEFKGFRNLKMCGTSAQGQIATFPPRRPSGALLWILNSNSRVNILLPPSITGWSGLFWHIIYRVKHRFHTYFWPLSLKAVLMYMYVHCHSLKAVLVLCILVFIVIAVGHSVLWLCHNLCISSDGHQCNFLPLIVINCVILDLLAHVLGEEMDMHPLNIGQGRVWIPYIQSMNVFSFQYDSYRKKSSL